MNSDRNKITISAFASYLKEQGLRDTYERRVILETILAINQGFDTPTLTAAIRDKGEHICRATIFNTVSLLIKANFLRRQKFADGTCLYEPTSLLPSGNQLHLICTSCGKISDIRNSAVIKDLDKIKYGSFMPSYISLAVYGLCSRCQRKKRVKSRPKDSIQLKLFK